MKKDFIVLLANAFTYFEAGEIQSIVKQDSKLLAETLANLLKEEDGRSDLA